MCEKHPPATFVRIAEDELCDAGAQMETATGAFGEEKRRRKRCRDRENKMRRSEKKRN